MDQTETYSVRLKKFVAARKVGLSCAATAIVTTIAVSQLQKSALKEAYDFIDAAGLTEKFLNSVPADEIYS